MSQKRPYKKRNHTANPKLNISKNGSSTTAPVAQG